MGKSGSAVAWWLRQTDPVNLGSIPNETQISHWWHQEVHPTKTAPTFPKSPFYLWASPARMHKTPTAPMGFEYLNSSSQDCCYHVSFVYDFVSVFVFRRSTWCTCALAACYAYWLFKVISLFTRTQIDGKVVFLIFCLGPHKCFTSRKPVSINAIHDMLELMHNNKLKVSAESIKTVSVWRLNNGLFHLIITSC